MENINDFMDEFTTSALEVYWDADFGEELCAWSVDWDKLDDMDNNYWKNEIAFHQPDVSDYSCVSESWNGILANLFDHNLSLDDREKKWELFKKEYGAIEWVWMYIYKWVDWDRKWWNEKNPLKKVTTFKVNNWSELFNKLVNKGLMFKTWYRTNAWLTKDKFDNWIIDNSIKHTKQTWGHAVYGLEPTLDWMKKWASVTIVNSYAKTSSMNIFWVNNIKGQAENWSFFKSAYFYIPNSVLNKSIDELKYENMIKLWIEKKISNWKNLEKPITRWEALVMATRWYFLAKNEK